MKLRIIAWTAVLALCTGLVLTAGCGTTDNNPFGSSGGSGGSGGGGGGTTAMTVLANNVAGQYNGVTVTSTITAAGVTDPISGDPVSTMLDLSQGSAGMGLEFCPVVGMPACSQSALWPTYAAMIKWTLKFDLFISMATTNINSIAITFGPAQCALIYNLPPAQWSSAGWVGYTVTPTMFNNSGCTSPPVPYVNTVFGITVLRAGAALATDRVYVDNVRWVH